MKIQVFVLKLLLFCFIFVPSVDASDYLIGTYYFPGWTKNAKGLEYPDPWKPIQKYPDKEPKLGWYSDNDPKVLRQQIDWMRQYGIKFVAFDWYWNINGVYLDQAINAFRASKIQGDMKFTILWANHYNFTGGMSEYKALVNYWASHYFSDPDFLTIDGKPVVFIFGIDFFESAAKSIGVSSSELVSVANNIAKSSGYSGIYFVGGTPALEHWVKRVSVLANFSALSSYNYHVGYSGTAESASKMTEGYLELDSAYRQNWKWFASNQTLPYIMPMTSGWDKRPWGGSNNPKHDESIATPSQFEDHLFEAKRIMDANPDKTRKMGVICCWNEFGEGSYIEPSKLDGFVYLEKIKKVFGQ